jgi:hypothetical protein
MARHSSVRSSSNWRRNRLSGPDRSGSRSANEEKSRVVDLTKGGVFGFLGFDFRQIPTKSGKMRPRYVPKLKKRTALLPRSRKIVSCARTSLGEEDAM